VSTREERIQQASIRDEILDFALFEENQMTYAETLESLAERCEAAGYEREED
jgi:hypothetical protein